jgi:hypothetical protein
MVCKTDGAELPSLSFKDLGQRASLGLSVTELGAVT